MSGPVMMWIRESETQFVEGQRVTIWEEGSMAKVDMTGLEFVPGPGEVAFGIPWSEGRTIDLGQYCGYRIDVGLTVPARATKEDLFLAFQFAGRLVPERVAATIAKRGLKDPLENPPNPAVRR